MSHDLLYAAGLASVLAAPLLGLLLLGVARTRGLVAPLLPWMAMPAVFVALLLPAGVVPTLPAPGGAGLGLDSTARAFLFAAGTIWALAGWFAGSWLRRDDARVVFCACWLVAMKGNFGLILAQDLLAFYSFFAVMSFSAYGLVIHGGVVARPAGRLYLAMVMMAEVALLAAISLAAGGSVPTFASPHEGPLPGLWLFALGFGIKLGVLGGHAWLPRAHPVAPLPASAVLSGVMIKAGALGWWRVAPHEAVEPVWGLMLASLGLAGALYGVLAGLPRHEPKAVLAWSSVSQMGLMVVLAGVGLLEPDARPVVLAAVALIALHHGFAKAALFLGVGVLARSDGRFRKLAWIALCLPALALAGAPLTSGAVAKSAIEAASQTSVVAGWLEPGLAISAFATTLLMLRLLYLVAPSGQGTDAVPVAGLWLPWSVLLVLVVLPVAWMGAVLPSETLPSFSPALSSVWPILAGMMLGAGAIAARRAFGRRVSFSGASRTRSSVPEAAGWMRVILRSEQRLRRWSTVGCATVGVLVLLMSVLWPVMA